MVKIKLTKKAIYYFIDWSSSRYNEYTKEEIVDKIYDDFIIGQETPYEVSYGSWTENKTYGHNSQGKYLIDSVNKTITQTHTGRTSSFEITSKIPKIVNPKGYYTKGLSIYKRIKRTWYKEVIKTQQWRSLNSPETTRVTHSGKWVKCGPEETKELVEFFKTGLLVEHKFVNLTLISITCELAPESK